MSQFEVGQQFEDFVEKRIFIASEYTLVEKTHNFNQNSERFVESSLNPDFKFRCNKNGQEFYVEAKYRSAFNSDDKLDLLKFNKLQRFQYLNNRDHPNKLHIPNLPFACIGKDIRIIPTIHISMLVTSFPRENEDIWKSS